MKNYYDVSVSELEQSVQEVLGCQQNILEIESKSAEMRSAMIQELWSEISAIERLFKC